MQLITDCFHFIPVMFPDVSWQAGSEFVNLANYGVVCHTLDDYIASRSKEDYCKHSVNFLWGWSFRGGWWQGLYRGRKFSDIVKYCFWKTIVKLDDSGSSVDAFLSNLFCQHSLLPIVVRADGPGTTALCVAPFKSHSTQSRGGHGRTDGFAVFHKLVADVESCAVFTLKLKCAAHRHEYDRSDSILGCYGGFDGDRTSRTWVRVESLLIWIVETRTQVPCTMERIHCWSL